MPVGFTRTYPIVKTRSLARFAPSHQTVGAVPSIDQRDDQKQHRFDGVDTHAP
jgi:hypothetical protein